MSQEEVYSDLAAGSEERWAGKGFHPPEPSKPSKEVQRWADIAMYEATPLALDPGELVKPRVTLTFMTPDPLRVMGASSELYLGNVMHDVEDCDSDTALRWLTDMTKTKLSTPLELIDFVFLFEGVTRAFTHQLVRQRAGAMYIQESQRFAVKANGAHEVRMPPSIERLKDDDPLRVVWEQHVARTADVYMMLINGGIPAEDARGLLETNITTRVVYKTNLRALAEHAGMRLCSQAQYEWKEVWKEMISEIITYGPGRENWQQRAIVKLFKPVCYFTGKCEFMGTGDRACRIRDRVMAHHAKGDTSDQWDDIHPHEALLEGAARVAPDAA
jgi:flavin-dependent thymidylate synthase